MYWMIKDFNSFSIQEMYDVFKLRQNVFILEQTCFYEDIDGKDQTSFHVLGYREDELVAYARIVEKGLTFEEISIGRVLIAKNERGKGTGKTLMEKCLNYVDEVLHETVIRISAQAYLKSFYYSLGFNPVSDEYLEDGIPHLEMVRKKLV
jgi:ElaA protein